MKNKDISSVIVMNESKTHIGIITERYVVYKIAQEDVTLLLQAQVVLSYTLITIKDTNSLIDALQIMNVHHFRRLPVTNSEQKLERIFTDKDIFKVILRNKDLLSNYYNTKNFESSYSILEFRDHNIKTIYKP